VSLVTGEQNLVDYSGKLISSITPMSSLVNYVGRVTNEGFKKEATTFLEKTRSKFRWLLDRDALDSYGRPIKETDYLYGATIKQYDANDPANAGAREVARLGITAQKMVKRATYKGLSTDLDEKQYWKMRRSLDTKFKLTDKLNKVIKTKRYLDANDYIRKEILTNIINKVKTASHKYILTDKDVIKSIKKQATKLKSTVERQRDSRPTYKDLIIKKVQ
jgi:hypothetical protein